MAPVSLRQFLWLFVLGFSLSCLFSCAAERETTYKRIKKSGVIRIGYANDVPYGYSSDQRELTGEAPEIAKIVMAKMGVHKMEGILVEFGSLIAGLKAGSYDMIAAGMFVTPDRCQEISFSEPTYRVDQAFAVKKGNPKNITSYEEIAEAENAIICVMEGAVESKYARAVGIPESRILTVPNTTTGLETIINGQADALALSSISIQNLLRESSSEKIEQARPFTNPVINGKEVKGYGAFGFRKEDIELLKEFNKHLTSFIGTKEHLDTVKPFGFTDFPEGITTAELCAN